MNFSKGTTIQISPCIVAQARFKLRLSTKSPSNTKRCSYDYWCRVIDNLALKHNLSVVLVDQAKQHYRILFEKL
jgi:hypothetical protein